VRPERNVGVWPWVARTGLVDAPRTQSDARATTRHRNLIATVIDPLPE
jgi:hypothetical protein